MSRYDIRTYREVEGDDASDLPGQIGRQQERVDRRLARVRRTVAVMSGKGGVGKSFLAAGLSVAVRRSGSRVGLLDADLVSPTARRMLGVARGGLTVDEGGVEPAESEAGIRIMSTDLLLEDEAPLAWKEPGGETFVWRGAQERGVLREFLGDVRWGELDLLVVDLPPGSGRLEQLAGLVPGIDGAVAVTLPSGASESSVERSLRLAREREIPLLGIVENMSGYRCPGCGSSRPLFPGRAGRELADAHGIPLLAEVPFDPRASELADRGRVEEALDTTAAGETLAEAGRRLANRLEGEA